MKRTFLLAFLAFSTTFLPSFSVLAQKIYPEECRVVAGPMLGTVGMREAKIWVQTNQNCAVSMVYWDSLAPEKLLFAENNWREKTPASTAILTADEVEPGRTYFYKIFVDWPGKLKMGSKKLADPHVFRTQPLWQYRTEPPEFTVAAGSCTYINEESVDRPGKPYGSEYEIFDAMAAKKPDLTLWLGDNFYLREADYFTETGIFRRFSQARQTPEMQKLLATGSHLAIWDDHDYGPNDADRTYFLKKTTKKAHDHFWANPASGLDGEGITSWTTFGDVDIWLLDNRSFRSPNDCRTCPKTVLGERQLRWFLESLTASRAPFKLVCMGGQFLNPAQVVETYSNLAPAERDTILNFIEKEKVRGVIFMTGDRHTTELSKSEKNGWPIYDLTTSSLTAGVSDRLKNEVNSLGVEGTYVKQHNFSTLRFSGKRKDRALEITVFDKDGKAIWTRKILEKEWQKG